MCVILIHAKFESFVFWGRKTQQLQELPTVTRCPFPRNGFNDDKTE